MKQKNKLYIVLGLGVTGISVVNFLSKNIDCNIVGIDTRDSVANIGPIQSLSNIKTYFAKPFINYKNLLDTADYIVISPGISLNDEAIVYAKRKNKKVISDIEIFSKFARVPIIAITGSNGKSTVTTLLGEMARAAGINVGVGGNLGIAALDILDDKKELYILELSSFQLDLLQEAKFFIGVVLNISPDHIDRHKSFASYKQAKLKIYGFSENIVFNRDDLQTKPAKTLEILNKSNMHCFSIDEQVKNNFIFKNNFIYYQEKKLISSKDINIIGKHNISNILACFTVASIAKININSCIEAIKTFRGIEHRSEIIGTFDGVLWINDSKGTNIGATKSAIYGISPEVSGKIILILGGESKGADFADLISPIKEYVKKVILIGGSTSFLSTLCDDNNIDYVKANSLQQVVELADLYSEQGDAVLFSPACSSFDMFKNFVERGALFKKEVKNAKQIL